MAMSVAEVQATMRFLVQTADTQGRIIVELVKVAGADLPDAARQTIHEHLRPLSEAAIDVPENVAPSVLPFFDRLVDLFPPPHGSSRE